MPINKLSLFKNLARVNSRGLSRIVSVHEFTGDYASLQLGNGGSWSRFDGVLGRQYKLATYKANGTLRTSWECSDREQEGLLEGFQDYRQQHNLVTSGNQILLLKLHGLQGLESGRPIASRIRQHFRGQSCVACGTSSQIEIDHKNGLYNDPHVLSVETQTPDDFQPLCKHCNDVKRQAIKKMRHEGRRPSGQDIPALIPLGVNYTQGDDTFNLEDVDWGVGTYWYDPIAFMRQYKMMINP